MQGDQLVDTGVREFGLAWRVVTLYSNCLKTEFNNIACANQQTKTVCDHSAAFNAISCTDYIWYSKFS